MFRHFIALVAAVFALNAYAAVDINRANRAELETVKGIGPGLSAKIMKAREAGAFKDWTDMVQRVPGVGPGNAGKLSQAGLTVSGAAFDASKLPPATTKARQRKAGAGTGSEAGMTADGSVKPSRKAAVKKDKAAAAES